MLIDSLEIWGEDKVCSWLRRIKYRSKYCSWNLTVYGASGCEKSYF